MWKVLAHGFYSDKSKSPKVALGAIKDVDGDIAKALGLEASEEKSRVVLWKKGDEAKPTVYEGEFYFTCVLGAILLYSSMSAISRMRLTS